MNCMKGLLTRLTPVAFFLLYFKNYFSAIIVCFLLGEKNMKLFPADRSAAFN